MTGPAWLIDSRRIASKIKNASETVDSGRFKWMSNPTKACPRCKHIIDNSDIHQEWPGLPRGVKFDPSDQELLWHLLAKVGKGGGNPHPFINEFIPTVDEDNGICYTHPQKLPGVKHDGSVSHFFHRTYKAYNTGTRKRRKIHSGDLGDVRWHKTGKTKPVIIDGKHLGCKKILVLYLSPMKGGKPEKTNWVMHQYHLGTGEDEQDGEFVVSKVFYQQQQKPNDKVENLEMLEDVTTQIDLVAGPSFVAGPHSPKQTSDQVKFYYGSRDEDNIACLESEKFNDPVMRDEDNTACPDLEKFNDPVMRDEDNTDYPESERPGDPVMRDGVHTGPPEIENPTDPVTRDEENAGCHEFGELCDEDNHPAGDTKWWEGESQFLLDSQQLAEGIAICDEFLQSQSSCAGDEAKRSNPCLSEYAQLAVEDLKKDLEVCRNMGSLDDANIELDTPPDFRLSQLEFGSQDSFLAWAGNKVAD